MIRMTLFRAIFSSAVRFGCFTVQGAEMGITDAEVYITKAEVQTAKAEVDIAGKYLNEAGRSVLKFIRGGR